MKNITIIPATIDPHTRLPKESTQRRRVAAYARVSTDSEEQLTSYEAQVDYYTRYIQSRPDWEFVGVYADEGISATNTKRRESFNRMVQDALDGKIDLIVTKSVSRFARNTVDSLTTVRKLKDAGVEVYFEKENIWTFDSKGELLLTIMSSLAQEESRNISENTAWGIRSKFQQGIPHDRLIGMDFKFGLVAVLIHHLHGDERKVTSVSFDGLTVGYQLDVMRLSCSVDFLFGYGFALVVVSHHLYGTRFVLGIHPHEAITLLTLEVSNRS